MLIYLIGAGLLVLQVIVMIDAHKNIKVDDPYFVELEQRLEKMQEFIDAQDEFNNGANAFIAGRLVMAETPAAQPGI